MSLAKKVYKISYHDDECEAETLIHSSHEVTRLEAKELLQEQLKENRIDAGEVVIDFYEEITNPILKLFL